MGLGALAGSISKILSWVYKKCLEATPPNPAQIKLSSKTGTTEHQSEFEFKEVEASNINMILIFQLHSILLSPINRLLIIFKVQFFFLTNFIASPYGLTSYLVQVIRRKGYHIAIHFLYSLLPLFFSSCYLIWGLLCLFFPLCSLRWKLTSSILSHSLLNISI